MVPSDLAGIFTNQPVVLAMFVVTGIILCLVGYRVFRVYSAAMGLLFGLLVSSYLCVYYHYGNVLPVILVSSLVSAVAFWLLYRLGLFATGAAAGYFVGLYLLPSYPIYSYALAALVGVTILFIERFVVILITAFLGATFITLATHMAINGLTIYDVTTDIRGALDAMFSNPLMFLLWLSLVVTGMVTQLTLLKEKTEEEEVEGF